MKKWNKSSTVDHDEIERFDKVADQWWDENGKYATLHTINPIRIAYIRDNILLHHKKISDCISLGGRAILDVGCGGGLISLPMARLGAKVTAIDASSANIKVAKQYAKKQAVEVDFMAISSEALAATNAKFDVIIAMEIIEHVADVELFMKSLATMLKPNGLLFMSTINRTIKARLAAKILAEYILRWVPVGTHDFDKFITPVELEAIASKYKLKSLDFSGIIYKPLTKTWSLSPNNLDINYLALFGNKD